MEQSEMEKQVWAILDDHWLVKHYKEDDCEHARIENQAVAALQERMGENK